jgi:hypothetical protein
MWPEAVLPQVDYLLGIDLAQGGSDYTALCALERTEPIDGSPATYAVLHLERFRDRRAPRRIVERSEILWQQLRRRHADHVLARRGSVGPRDVAEPPIRIVVDTTGVGPFGTDPLRQVGFAPTSIVIHGGDSVSHPAPDVWRVPKRDLAGVLATLLGTARLQVAASLPEAPLLRAELENFRVNINVNTGHDSYAAGVVEEWRAGTHDDLVLAVAIACWVGEARPVPRLDPAIALAWTDLPG